jgi:hypothetical protein
MVFVLFFGMSIKSAYAYVDPGTGSIVTQMLIGALVGMGIALKLYWYKLKDKFMRIRKNE